MSKLCSQKHQSTGSCTIRTYASAVAAGFCQQVLQHKLLAVAQYAFAIQSLTLTKTMHGHVETSKQRKLGLC